MRFMGGFISVLALFFLISGCCIQINTGGSCFTSQSSAQNVKGANSQASKDTISSGSSSSGSSSSLTNTLITSSRDSSSSSATVITNVTTNVSTNIVVQ